jgi:hypothetical protein
VKIYFKLKVIEIFLKIQIAFLDERVFNYLNFGLLLILSSESENLLSKPDNFIGFLLVEAVKLVVVLLDK